MIKAIYRREIDLGDGSGKQVFEAESVEELLDKLTEAQEHATRKIRELSAASRPPVEAYIDGVRAQGREPGPQDIGMIAALTARDAPVPPWDMTVDAKAERKKLIEYIRRPDLCGFHQPDTDALARNPDLREAWEHRQDPYHPSQQRISRFLSKAWHERHDV